MANTLNADWGKVKGSPQRLAILLGMKSKQKAGIPSEIDRSQYSQEKYKFLLCSPFKISDKCCDVMKKHPAHIYAKETGNKPMTAQIASESRLRTQKWINNGCNGFYMKQPISNPMAFWTEQDVLTYIYINSIQISQIYGDVVIDDLEQLDGQMNIGDFLGYELFDKRPLLKTTGLNRTGCMFCGYGCHLEKSPNRFEQMKITHPKQYEYIMKPVADGGLGYKEVIDWLNENGNLNIKY